MKRILASLLAVFFIAACSGPVMKPDKPKGVYHCVKKGETLWSISQAYKIDIQELAEINNIMDPDEIEADAVLFIPGADHVVEIVRKEKQDHPPKKPAVKPAPVLAKSEKKAGAPPPPAKKSIPPAPVPAALPKEADRPAGGPHAGQQRPEVRYDKGRFIWPLKGAVVSKYGIQKDGLKNNGIKISAREGAAVLASARGEVTYSDHLKYYGDTVIVRHDDNFSTVYSSLKARGVKVGDRVKKGDRIALVGRPESNAVPFLNFEIRHMNKPRNPLFFLP